jgi:S-adenosylmethionine:tRNA ribosyltransferase-isomerase
MIAASTPDRRREGARLLNINPDGQIEHVRRSNLLDLFERGDLVIANDAATLPASLHGTHVPSGLPIEVRLAGRSSLAADDVRVFIAVVFGAGDFHMRTEDRPQPPPLCADDELALGPLHAIVLETVGHPRLVRIAFRGAPAEIWQGIATHGVPIQYAHVPQPLALWNVWTPVAAVPAAFEPPSAGFVLDWQMLGAMGDKGVDFATLTHAAGISSTGDPLLDARLPLPEPYVIPARTAQMIERARGRSGRIVAIGTTVVRALEHAGRSGRVKAGPGVANQRIGPQSRLNVVDAIVSGTHDVASSHYQLLGALARADVLQQADDEMLARGYLTHEFGDFMFIERRSKASTSRNFRCLSARTERRRSGAEGALLKPLRLRSATAKDSIPRCQSNVTAH